MARRRAAAARLRFLRRCRPCLGRAREWISTPRVGVESQRRRRRQHGRRQLRRGLGHAAVGPLDVLWYRCLVEGDLPLRLLDVRDKTEADDHGPGVLLLHRLHRLRRLGLRVGNGEGGVLLDQLLVNLGLLRFLGSAAFAIATAVFASSLTVLNAAAWASMVPFRAAICCLIRRMTTPTPTTPTTWTTRIAAPMTESTERATARIVSTSAGTFYLA